MRNAFRGWQAFARQLHELRHVQDQANAARGKAICHATGVASASVAWVMLRVPYTAWHQRCAVQWTLRLGSGCFMRSVAFACVLQLRHALHVWGIGARNHRDLQCHEAPARDVFESLTQRAATHLQRGCATSLVREICDSWRLLTAAIVIARSAQGQVLENVAR